MVRDIARLMKLWAHFGHMLHIDFTVNLCYSYATLYKTIDCHSNLSSCSSYNY